MTAVAQKTVLTGCLAPIDKNGLEQLIAKVRKRLRSSLLDRLTAVPVDIEPKFTTAAELTKH